MNRNAYQNNSIGAQQQMDMITYHYLTGTNKLDYVDDQAPPQWSGDIKQQATANYKYDGISNLPHDVSEGKMIINWNVYGKIKYIKRNYSNGGMSLQFKYDASGNRIKKDTRGFNQLTTWYVRDASGNIMSMYEYDYRNPIKQTELSLYGSDRVGVYNANIALSISVSPPEKSTV